MYTSTRFGKYEQAIVDDGETCKFFEIKRNIVIFFKVIQSLNNLREVSLKYRIFDLFHNFVLAVRKKVIIINYY